MGRRRTSRQRAHHPVVCHLHPDRQVTVLGADRHQEEESATEYLQEVATIGRDSLENVDDLVGLRLEIAVEPLLVLPAEIVSHGVLRQAWQRLRP